MAQAIGKKSKNASDGGVDINDFQVRITSLHHPSLDEVFMMPFDELSPHVINKHDSLSCDQG